MAFVLTKAYSLFAFSWVPWKHSEMEIYVQEVSRERTGENVRKDVRETGLGTGRR